MSLKFARKGFKELCYLVSRDRYSCGISIFNYAGGIRCFYSYTHHAYSAAKLVKFPLRSTAIDYRRFSATSIDPTAPAQSAPQNKDGKGSSKDYPSVLEPSEQVLSGLSPEDQRKLKILAMEREVFRQTGHPVPRWMTDRMWLEVLDMDNRTKRIKHYRFLLINENHELHDKAKKAELRERRLSEPRKLVAEGELVYGLNNNTIFQMLRETTMNVHYNHWQCHGILFGQSIVVDMDYDYYMSPKEYKNCADQIRDMYAANKVNRDPFHFYLCNARPGNRTYETVQSYLPNLNTPTNLMNVRSECYLDLFPREKLVYLTPHCQETLTRYDHDAVYIIGGIVDKTVTQPLSLAKAKKQGIAMARLPLDSYLEWGSGSGKSLTLDQMMKIMLDIKNTGDWNAALVHVPKRKLRRDDDKNFKRIPAHIRRRSSIYKDD